MPMPRSLISGTERDQDHRIDSDVNSSQVSCRIGTNNLQAGIKAAEAALATDDEELYIGIGTMM